MQKVNDNHFIVGAGEHVTVTVTAHGVIQAGASFVVDSPTLVHPSAAVWEFDVTAPALHNGIFDFSFPPGTPAGARFTTSLDGSAGGGALDGPSATHDDQPGVMFEVQ